MSNRLKKKDSPTSLAFEPESVVILLQLIEGDESAKRILQCKSNGKDQLQLVKELTKKLKNGCSNQSIEFICQMFIHCKSRHPLRRTLSSFITNLNEDNSQLVLNSMSCILCDTLNKTRNETSVKINEIHHVHLQDKVELVSSLMENFSKGDEVIQKNSNEIFRFLEYSLQTFVKLSRTNDGPVFQTQMIHASLVVFKTIIGVLQKCEKPESRVLDTSLEGILPIALDVTTDKDFLIECRNAAAMILPSMLLHFPGDLDNVLSHLSGHVDELTSNSKVYRMTSDIKRLLDGQQHSIVIVTLHAILVKLVPYALTKRNIAFYRDVFVERLKNICSKSSDKNTLVLAFKTFNTWIMSYKDFLDVCGDGDGLCNLLAIDIVPFLITYIDHGIDTIRHSVTASLKESFNVLAKVDAKVIDVLGQMYFTSDSKSRGKLSILTSLCEVSSMKILLGTRPTFPSEVIDLLADVDLATHAANLYKIASQRHLSEVQENTKNLSLAEWKATWVDDISPQLLCSCKDTKANLTNLIVPNILKVNGAVMKDILFAAQVRPSLECFYTAVVFLKSARSMKNISQDAFQIQSTANDASSTLDTLKWKGIFDMNMLNVLIINGNDQVRLDVLSLICCPVKTTDHVDENDTKLIKRFLKYNMAVENPAFRQQTVNCLKRLFVRIFSHSYQLTKSKDARREQTNRTYGGFISWFINHIFSMLHLNAPYCQVSFTLELISITTDFFLDQQTSEVMKHVQIPDAEKVENTGRLLACLKDTYDPNRLLVLNIFKKNPIFCCNILDEKLMEILADAWDKLSSPQPDISSIAAYQICFVSININKINSHILRTVKNDTNNMLEDPFIGLLDMLYHLLLKQLTVMKSSLLKASQNGPVHGILFTLRLLFQIHKLDLRSSIVCKYRELFVRFVNRFIQTGLEIIDLVSPYVTNEAPEGQLCNVNLSDLFDMLQVHEKSMGDIVLQAHIARMILVCCWRSMKEVSLLLGTFVSNFFSVREQENILSDNVLTDMWTMFSNIMLRSKHAGAYELASVGFIKLCSTLWVSPSESLRLLPENAVKNLVSDLVSVKPLENAQVTRRSAGLPFYLQSLCSTEPEINAYCSFNHLMSSLTDLCLKKSTNHDINKLVISLNVLRAFYKDAKMSEDVFPYISQGVMIALNGFGSALWPIRNSCTLLFSTLMQRIFGVKKFKMTGREFFSRYSQLYPFLMEQTHNVMISASDEERKHVTDLHPSVFPILLLLSHLYPSTVEGTDSLMKLDIFMNALIKLGSNAVYKTRIMAANALMPLISLERTPEFVQTILNNINQYQSLDERGLKAKQNAIHGMLLQMKALLSKWCSFSQEKGGCPALIMYATKQFEWLTQSPHISSHSKKVVIDILVLFFKRGFLDTDNTAILENHIRTAVLYFQRINLNEELNAGHSLLLRSMAEFFLELLKFPCWQSVLMNIFGEGSICIDFKPSTLILLMIQSNVIEVVTEVVKSFQNVVKAMAFDKVFVNELFGIISRYDISKMVFPKLVSIFVSVLDKNDDIDRNQILSVYEKCMSKDIAIQREEEIICTLSVISILVKQEEFKTGEMVTQEKHSDMWRYINTCTLPTQSFAVRMKVKNLLNPMYCLDITKEDQYRLYDSVINLLNDCDVDVRVVASEAIFSSMFSQDESNQMGFVPQPRYIFEKFISEVLATRLKLDPCGCLLYLLNVCNHEYMYDEVDRGRSEGINGHTKNETFYKPFVVFEQGKENPYWDDEFIRVTIIDLIERELPNIIIFNDGADKDILKNYLNNTGNITDKRILNVILSIKEFIP